MVNKGIGSYCALIGIGASMAGCGLLGSEETAEVNLPRIDLAKYRRMAEKKPEAPAGITVEPVTGLDNLKKLVASRSFSSRPDPFSLLSVERKFENEQDAERLLQTNGGFLGVWTPPVVTYEDVETVEPQPVRRLAGVIVSNGSVMVLIDMGDGKGLQTARPGSKLGEWTVATITTEEAVLKRDPKKRPSQVIVPLASPLDLGTPNTGAGTGANPNGGRFPGGPPPIGGPGGPMGGPGSPNYGGAGAPPIEF